MRVRASVKQITASAVFCGVVVLVARLQLRGARRDTRPARRNVSSPLTDAATATAGASTRFGWPGAALSVRRWRQTGRNGRLLPLDIQSFVDMHHPVVDRGGGVVLYGLTESSGARALRAIGPHLPRYERVDRGPKVALLPPVPIRADRSAWDAARCASVRNETAVLLFLWFVDNQYHLINDNLVPLLVNLQNHPACTASADGAVVCSPPVTLYTQADSGPRMQHARALAGLVLGAAVKQVRPASELLTGGPHCVRRLTWGRGRRAFPTVVETSLWRAVGLLRRLAMGVRDDHAPRPTKAAATSGAALRGGLAVLIRRPRGLGARWIGDEPDLLGACASAGLDCRACCAAWDRPALVDSLALVSTASVVFGAHGAGLSMLLFAKRGAVLVDFLGGDSDVYLRIFPRMAWAVDGESLVVTVSASPRTGLLLPPGLANDTFACAARLPERTPACARPEIHHKTALVVQQEVCFPRACPVCVSMPVTRACCARRMRRTNALSATPARMATSARSRRPAKPPPLFWL